MLYEGFIFDLDGVLTDTSEYHFKAWQTLGQTIGVHFDRSFNESLKGVGRMDSLERILAFGGKSKSYSIDEKRNLAQQKNSLYVEMIQDMSPKDLFEGVDDLLRRLMRKNVKLAIGRSRHQISIIVTRKW